MLRFAVCDDKKEWLDLVADKIREYYPGECEIIKYMGGGILLADTRTKHFDVLFLDIVMPGINGIELAEQIRKENKTVMIVFVTNRDELAHMGYKCGAFRFVRKSKLEHELLETAESLKKYFCSAGEHLTLKTPDGEIIKAINDIKYFEVMGHNITVISTDKERVCGTMQEYEDMLSKNGFIRIHKGYLVNFRFICSIHQQEVILTDGNVLPLSRNRTSETKKKLREFMGNIKV